MTDWKRDDLVYLAALLEGEGYFSQRDSGALAVRMASSAITGWAHQVFGGRLRENPPREAHHKLLYEWHLEKQDVLYELLPAIEPFLKHKALECAALYALVQHAVENKPRVRNHPANPDVAVEWEQWHAERERLQQNVKGARDDGELILVVDPGERIGWVRAGPIGSELVILGHGITPAWDFVRKLGEVIGNYDTVIYESYRIYAHLAKQHIGSDVPTAQIVGVIRYLAMLHPSVKLVSQGASCMKTGIKVAPPAIAEILARLPKSHDEAHDGSALAHLSSYWFKNYAR